MVVPTINSAAAHHVAPHRSSCIGSRHPAGIIMALQRSSRTQIMSPGVRVFGSKVGIKNSRQFEAARSWSLAWRGARQGSLQSCQPRGWPPFRPLHRTTTERSRRALAPICRSRAKHWIAPRHQIQHNALERRFFFLRVSSSLLCQEKRCQELYQRVPD